MLSSGHDTTNAGMIKHQWNLPVLSLPKTEPVNSQSLVRKGSMLYSLLAADGSGAKSVIVFNCESQLNPRVSTGEFQTFGYIEDPD